MSLREKQSKFARMVGLLIQEAYNRGFEVTLGEAYRSPEEAKRLAQAGKGIVNSLHVKRLAIDINLFKDGYYLPGTEAHESLGTWWEGIGGTWGGRFGDGGHYSLEHEGVK